MSSIFLDTEINAVSIVLNKRDGSGSTTLRLGLEFYDTSAIYPSSPITYPALVTPPRIQRSLGVNVANRHEVNIEIYAKAHLTSVGKSFVDLLHDHEFIGGTATFYYYPKPRDAALGADSSSYTRMVTEIVSFSQDDVSGILALQTREVWFKDRDCGKQLTSETFSDIDPDWDGEYGALVLGDYTSTNGIIIDAPFIESGIDGSNRPYAKAFSGWTTAAHPNKEKKKIYVLNQEGRKNRGKWMPLGLDANAQNVYAGNTTWLSGVAPADRCLNKRDLLFVHQPTTNARILTALRFGVGTGDKGFVTTDFSTSNYASNGNVDLWQPNDNDNYSMSVGAWVCLTNNTADATIACVHAGTGAGQRAWRLFYSNSANRFRFEVYNSSGTSIKTVDENVLGAPSTNTWYFIQAQIIGASTVIRIRANNNAWTTSTAYAGNPAVSRAGLRVGVMKSGGANTAAWAGRMCSMFFADEALNTTILDHFYNSGNGRRYRDVSATNKEALSAWWDMDDALSGILEDRHGRNDLKITGTLGSSSSGKISETVTKDDGELKVSIYAVDYNSSTGNHEPVGSPLREILVNVEDTAVQFNDEGTAQVQVWPPLVLDPDELYGFQLTWSNKTTFSKWIAYTVENATPAFTTYFRDKYSAVNGWQPLTDTLDTVHFALYCVGEGVETWEDGTGSDPDARSYQYLEAKSITLMAGDTRREFTEGVRLKAGIYGLEDDGSGTLTGTAGLLLSNPAQIIRFLLQNSVHGLGLSNSNLNTSSFSTAASSLAGADLYMGVPIDYSVSIRDLIIEICRQARLILYRDRDGKIALKYPAYTSTGWGVYLNEAVLRADCLLLGSSDSDEADLVNDFKQLYAPDVLNLPKDASFIRRAETDKYSGMELMRPTSSSSGDTRRQSLCSSSQALYGKREMNEPLDFYDNLTRVRKVQGYYVDRYTMKQQIAVVRLPRLRYYSTVDLFSTVEIQHSGLRAQNGSGFDFHTHASELSGVLYSEGIPSIAWGGGTLAGEVISVIEEGPFLTATISTAAPF